MNTGYENFEIAIDPIIDLHYPVRVRTALGQEFRGTLVLPLTNDRYIAMQSKIDYHIAPTEDEIIDFGTLLYETLFQGKIGEAFQTAKDQAAKNGNVLRIRLSIDPGQSAVALCPWEFIADDAGFPLATKHSFCRHIPRTDPIPALTIAPNEILKLVITSALPKELIVQHRLDVAAEIAGIKQSLKPLVDNGLIIIVEISHLTGLKLQRMLRDERPHIVHYVGHGTVNRDSGFLVLENDDGSRQDMTALQLGILFRDSSVRLVVLNACKTSAVVTKLLRGIAPALMNANIPAVVGMQSSVLDQAGRAFAEEFYRALASGTPIDGCVADGRKAIIARSLSNLDWGLATLYMRASNGILFDGLNPKPRPTGLNKAEMNEIAYLHDMRKQLEQNFRDIDNKIRLLGQQDISPYLTSMYMDAKDALANNAKDLAKLTDHRLLGDLPE